LRCSSCNAENPDNKRFCGDCGASLPNFCAKCGVANPPDKRFCGDCGATLVSSGQPSAPRSAQSESFPADVRLTAEQPYESGPIDGERKTITALFADIKGSTELMEQLDPEEARALIDPALKLMIEAVNRYDGYVVQSTGDGIFALFGAPSAHEDHPQRALYGALRLQDELKRYSAGLRTRGGSPIEARIGVNTGEVVVRSIPTGAGHSEYSPVGHTANLASRMQTIAPSGSIVVTESTRALVEGYFRMRPLGEVTLKGIAGPLSAYEVLGLGALRTRLQRAAGRGLTSFVSRETELQHIKRALELARNGQGQMVAAVGEPGIGKSRLFYEFKAVSQNGNLLLEAYSVSHGKASAYFPVTELLRDYFRILPKDDPRQRREKVAGKIVILDRSLEDTLPYLYSLLGIAEGDPSLKQMDPQIRRRRTHDAIKRVLLRESLNQPLILMFEDLHWIDADTQGLLEAMCDSIASARVLLLVNYRPEYQHEWVGRSYYSQLRLDPLGPKGANEMLTALLGDAPELAPLKQVIAARTEGNPFFIEEIVQGLFEEGVLTGNGRVKLARPFSHQKIPTTVQGMLAARIDRLPRGEKELLQTLAAIGREFPLRLARQVTSRTEQQLDTMLDHLQSAEFIHEQPAPGDVEYIFKHALTQEVSYNSLLLEHRKLLHERIAEAIETLFVEHLDDHLKDLAHHYRRSNNNVKAIEYLRRAGEQSAVRAFYEEAIEQLSSALELLENLNAGKARDGNELAVRTALTGPLVAVRSLVGVENLLNNERLLELCRESGNTRHLALVLLHLFFFHRSATSLDEAGAFALRGMEVAESSGGEYEIFCGNFTSGLLAAERGEYLSARQHLERAVGISQQTQDLIIADPNVALGFLNCVGYLVTVCWVLGYPDSARGYADPLAQLLKQSLPVNAHAIGTHHLLTTRCDFLREYDGARVLAQEAVDRSSQSGFGWGIAFGTIGLGRIMVAEGDASDGIKKLEGIDASQAAIDKHWASCLAARAYLSAHRATEGSTIVQEAIAAIAAGGSRLFEAELHRMMGEFILMDGEALGEAEAAFNFAISIARRQQAKSFQLRATMSLARLLAKRGKTREARAMLAEIYSWFTEGFDTADLKDAKALLDELSTL
jgi:class 3 adenylate cyclase/tetratricopeptide (TPR) repeat protein